MTDPIRITSFGQVETVTLARPEALNAMDEPMILALQDYFRTLAERPQVRVVILNAEGRAFCAGLDLKGWAPRQQDGETEGAVHGGWRTQRAIATVMQLMRSCPQPVIACAQGAACGGGMSLLLASDVRYCTPDFRMNAAYIRIGLGGCDMGSSYFLPRLVGSSLASEMILSGRFVGAERALAAGFVSEIAEQGDIMARAEALAADMLLASPMGLRLSKDVLNRNIDATGFEAALALEDRQQIMLSMTEDYAEARRAFAEKRVPQYRDR
ncbi:enoyl-CoA hydratase/isomerase family protein [Blastomonas sp.]|uniref:enoyl-CoA hydratase/isomerase family protein n=1 Tax=Blastomonas sp. TaxID=1909299 RepID=UPI0026121CB9|nr:enoyl-CoA hydratase/isomerase family protein [Blastomonas sp.]MDM7955964.1 enoyl-CoA hydratase/isomerase family protein [Blastomonas sp.]